MVTVKLSESSSINSLRIDKQILELDGSLEVPIQWALRRISDPNLSFTFSKEDLEEVDEETLFSAGHSLGNDEITIEELRTNLLPEEPKKSKPKKVTPKKTTTKKTETKE